MLGNILQRLSVQEEARSEDEPAADGGAVRSASESGDRANDPLADDIAADAKGEPEPVVEWDTLFHTLENQRRRRVLRLLADRSDPITLGSLAEAIAARECDRDVDHLASQERKRVYIALYQCHLPKMDDAGAVAYEKGRGVIERGPRFERFERYLPESENPHEPVERDAGVLGPLTAALP